MESVVRQGSPARCAEMPGSATRPALCVLGRESETAAGKTERTARRIYTTIYELASPDAIATPEFRAMRGWYQFAPHVRSRTQVIVPVQG